MYEVQFDTLGRTFPELEFITAVTVAEYFGLSLILSYRDGKRIATGREVVPTRVWRGSDGMLLMTTECMLRDGKPRTFRLDRIVSVTVGNSVPAKEPEVSNDVLFYNQAKAHVESLGISLEDSDSSLMEDEYGHPTEVHFFFPYNPDRFILVKSAWWDAEKRRGIGLVVTITDHP